MSRRREDDRYSRYDERKPRPRRSRSRSRGADRSTAASEGNDLWDAQFSEASNFPRAPPAPSYSHEGGTSYGATSAYGSYGGIYDEFSSIGGVPAAPQPPAIQWNLPPAPAPAANPPAPAPAPAPTPTANLIAEQIKKEAAIESEVRHQRAALTRQREEYIRKESTLRKELETLKDQRNELRGDTKRSPSPDSKRFLKENAKLQLEIQNKLKTINNVVDMLNGIIGSERGGDSERSDGSPERDRTKKKSRSPAKDKKFNYVYYDPEMHWCRICNHFPPTAKDYLNHLHSPQHHKAAAAHLEAPWHGKAGSGGNEALPTYPAAPTKRTPIRGLQFFVPSTAWYCKLCDQWIGDLHCASAHLKSVTHSRNYTNFVEQNPHWETDWMSDRQKAFEKTRAANKTKGEDKSNYTAHTITFDKDGFTKKKKEKSATPGTPERRPDKKEKKIKRRRSSSSSSSSSSDQQKRKKEKKVNKKAKEWKQREADERDEKMIALWMSSLPTDKLSDKDRKLLENLKNSMNRTRDNKEQRRERPDRERQRERERVSQVTGRQETREEERDKSKETRASNGSAARPEKDKEPPPAADKKPETKKMPFIGKMPVFKTLTKSTRVEEQKEAEQKRQEEEAAKRKSQEVTAEIQRKVAEFKQKMKQRKSEIAPPGVALPTSLGGAVPPVNFTQPPPPLPAPPAPLSAGALAAFPQTVHRVQKDPVLVSGPAVTAAPPPPKPGKKGPLHRDFQEALDIIFPSERKEAGPPPDLPFPPGPPPGPPGPGGPPPGPPGVPFGAFGPMMPMNPPPPLMMGYDFNPPPMFAPPGPPQLYDRQVPIVPSQQPPPLMPPANIPPPPHQHQHQQHQQIQHHQQRDSNRTEMEDLAMLGIDAADVGALIH